MNISISFEVEPVADSIREKEVISPGNVSEIVLKTPRVLLIGETGITLTHGRMMGSKLVTYQHN